MIVGIWLHNILQSQCFTEIEKKNRNLFEDMLSSSKTCFWLNIQIGLICKKTSFHDGDITASSKCLSITFEVVRRTKYFFLNRISYNAKGPVEMSANSFFLEIEPWVFSLCFLHVYRNVFSFQYFQIPNSPWEQHCILDWHDSWLTPVAIHKINSSHELWPSWLNRTHLAHTACERELFIQTPYIHYMAAAAAAAAVASEWFNASQRM